MPDNDDYDVPKSDEEICECARKCWRSGIEAEAEFREQFQKRMRFREGDQWNDSDIAARGKDRPAIVVNLLEQPIQQVVNQILKARPGGKVAPGDENATPQVAEYLQGRIRHIEYQSFSTVAYSTCISYVASAGVGLVGLTVDYVSPDSTQQEPRIRTIKDPANWVLDQTYREVDARDRRWAIGRQQYSVEEFKRIWPDATVVDASFYGQDATFMDWGDGQNVWVGEYWRMDFKKRKLHEYADGTSGFSDSPNRNGNGHVRLNPTRTVTVQYPYVTQYLISGSEVLDKTPWLGKRIPIYEVVATAFYSDGKRVIKSLGSDSMASQQVYNCSESLKLESLVLAPKPKWLATQDQVAGHEQAWKNANTSHDSVLFYSTTVDSRGNPVPMPEWKVFVPPVQMFDMVSQQAKGDVKQTTGFFDAALGNLDPKQQSGRAILALQEQTGHGVSHYSEHLSIMMQSLYTDLIEIDLKLRPKRPHSASIIKPDGKHALVRVNDEMSQMPLMLDQGQYGVVISTGPSDKAMHEATKDFCELIAERDPQGWALIRDIGARLMEPQLGRFADEIANRWTPPQFANQDPNAPPLPPQAQQAMAAVPQMQQQIQQLEQIIKGKQVEEQGKFQRQSMIEEQKFKTEELKASTQLQVAETQAKNDAFLAEIDARIKILQAGAMQGHELQVLQHEQAHEHAVQKEEHAHEKEIGREQRDHEAELAATQQQPAEPAEA
jgi:hypothetical protein